MRCAPGGFGPSSAARTHGLLVPNQARYQLRYTRIFTFLSLYHGGEENQRFSVCGHLCGQSRFCAVFGNRGKSRKRRCHKALRRFALTRPGYNHGTPKPRVLSAELHPDIHFSAMVPRQGGKSKIFLSVVIYVVKAAFMPLSAIAESPANAGVTRLCSVSPCPVPDTATALPNQARYQLRYTRIFNFCHYTTAGKKIKDFSVCGHLCGQSHFRAVFGNRRKTRYRPYRKAFRAFVQTVHG